MRVTETSLFVAAAASVVGSALAYARSVLRPYVPPGEQPPSAKTHSVWRIIEQNFSLVAFLCTIAGLVLAKVEGDRWPLTTPAEVVFASAGSALLWHTTRRQDRQPRWAPLLFYVLLTGLFLWALTHWPAAKNTDGVEVWQQAWTFASHLALAVSCGAFIQAGSVAMASVLTTRDRERSSPQPESNVALWGLAALTTSLLITALGGLYTQGIHWSWASSEPWQLLLWLFYVAVWCGSILLEWRGWRLWIWTALGSILTMLMLGTMVV